MEINLFEGMEYVVYESKDIQRHYDYLEPLVPGHCYIVVEIYKNRVKERTEIKGPYPDVLADEVIREIKKTICLFR